MTRARARSRSRARSSSNAQPASFQPNVVGSAWMPCERPMQIVLRCSSARATTAASARSRPATSSAPASLDLQRERGVDDVRRRQPVVHPAAFRAELLGDRVDERGEVVVGRQLDLGDALGRRHGAPARGSRAASRGGHRADLGPAVERGELDLEPARELALLRPDPAHLRAGVAGDHPGQCRSAAQEGGCEQTRGCARRARRRSSRCRRRPSRPGRRAASARSRAARRGRRAPTSTSAAGRRSPAARCARRRRPAARRPARRRRSAPSARARPRVLAYSATASGVRCAERTSNSQAIPRASSSSSAACIRVAVGLRADEDADDGALSHLPAAAMSLRKRTPSNETSSTAA